MGKKVRVLVVAALMAALTCVATMIVKIPSPLKGYINLGDCIVLLSGWILPPGYGFFAAGLGSALADLFSGYILYAPATLVVKGIMALFAFGGFRLLHKNTGNLPARIISGVVSEIFMILGYFLFEGILYGFGPAAVNILPNGVQGIIGLVVGIIMIKFFEKSKVTL